MHNYSLAQISWRNCTKWLVKRACDFACKNVEQTFDFTFNGIEKTANLKSLALTGPQHKLVVLQLVYRWTWFYAIGRDKKIGLEY